MRLIPRALKQAVNRATLPVNGVPVAYVSCPFTKEMVNKGGFDEEAEAIEDAEEAFRYMDTTIYGPGEKWAPWFDMIDNGRSLITVTRDEESDKARDITILMVKRARVLLAIPKARWWNHFAVTFLRVNFHGDLWR